MKIGNPKKKSRFICLKCGKMDQCIDGIQRNGREREKYHIKDMWCCHCKEETKCLEVRYKDYLPDILQRAEILHDKYYGRNRNAVSN